MAPDLAYDPDAGRRHSSHLVLIRDARRRHTQDRPKTACHSAICWEVFIAKSPFGWICCVRYRMLEACESERRESPVDRSPGWWLATAHLRPTGPPCCWNLGSSEGRTIARKGAQQW